MGDLRRQLLWLCNWHWLAVIRFTLPWPPKNLSPNARAHYMAKARSVRKYRGEAALVVGSRLEAFVAPLVSIVFRPPDKRRRDLDNCLASFKAGLDGIADALGVNDNKFTLKLEMGSPVKGGDIEVQIAER